MARTTKISAVYMVTMFATGGDAIVTCNTVSVGKRRMIRNSNGGCPCIGVVANITFRGSDKMGGAFTGCDYIVMTTGT